MTYPAYDELSDTRGELRDIYEEMRAEIERLKELWFFDANPMKTEYAAEWQRAIRSKR